MRPVRKQYGFNDKDLIEAHFLDVLSCTIKDSRTNKTLTLSAADLEVSTAIGSAFLSALARLYDGRRGRAQSAWYALKKFCAYLSAEEQPDVLERIDRDVFERYRLYLRQVGEDRQLCAKTIFKQFRIAQNIAAEALRTHGISLNVIDNPFPGISRAGEPKPHLSRKALLEIIKAAKQDVTRIWACFELGGHVDCNSPLGYALKIVREEYCGIVPAPRLQNRTLRTELGPVDLEELASYVHATTDSLVPYMILIDLATAANIQSLSEFKRDCQSEGVIPGSTEIRWLKRRSTSEQIVIRANAGRYSAPTLIQQVLELTAPLLPHASTDDRSYLFISRNGENMVTRFSPTMWQRAIHRFVERHDLRDNDGTPLRLNFDMIRPTVLAELYRRTKSVLAVRRFAGHQHLATTVRYVVDRVTDELHDGAIVRVQGKLRKFILAGSVSEAEGEHDPVPARGISRDCKDIYDGPAVKGQCPAWIWPLNDPSLVVPEEPKPIAELLRLKDAIEEAKSIMHPAAFKLRYSEALASIDDILGRFNSEAIERGRSLATLLPKLASLADE